jgi:hypothetical protein
MIDELRCALEFQTAMVSALRDEGYQCGELAAAWLERWPNASPLRKGVMGNVLAFGYKTTGEIGRGLEVLVRTRRWVEQPEGYTPIPHHLAECSVRTRHGRHLVRPSAFL